MKVIKVNPKLKEELLTYIHRIEELQKNAPSDVLYIGEYIDTEHGGKKYYFQGNDLPVFTEGVEYTFLEHGSGTIRNHYNDTILKREHGMHYYTYHSSHGIITSDELNACFDENPTKEMQNVEELGDRKTKQREKVYCAWYAEEIAQAKEEAELKFQKNQEDGIELLDAAIELGDALTDKQAVLILESLCSYCVSDKYKQSLMKDNPVFSSEQFAKFMSIISKRHEADDIGYGRKDTENLEEFYMPGCSCVIHLRPEVLTSGQSLMDGILSRIIYDYNNDVLDPFILSDLSYEAMDKLKKEELKTDDWSKRNASIRNDGFGKSPKDLKKLITGELEVAEDAEF